MQTYHMDLSGVVAVITGAGGVLCSGFAADLAACGAAVALLDINLEAAERAASAIREAGGKALAVKADCLSAESLRAAREAVAAAFGPCSLLVNGAGGNNAAANTSHETLEPSLLDDPAETSFFDLDSAAFGKVFDLNVRAAVLTTQVFARDMVSTGGNIINISSMNAFRPLTKIPAYSGAKAAVSNFTQWLAVHFSKVGIRVNAIAPGFFVTDQNRALLKNPDGSLTPRSEKILSQTPMGRFGEAEELIGTLLFLVSDEAASFVNGVVIPVDGGFAAYSGV